MRGRPVLGGISGFLLGVSVAVLLQQYSIRPLDNLSVIGLPLVGLVVGIAWAAWAPLGRRAPAVAAPPPVGAAPMPSAPDQVPATAADVTTSDVAASAPAPPVGTDMSSVADRAIDPALTPDGDEAEALGDMAEEAETVASPTPGDQTSGGQDSADEVSGNANSGHADFGDTDYGDGDSGDGDGADALPTDDEADPFHT